MVRASSYLSPHPPFIVPEPFNTALRSGRLDRPSAALATGSDEAAMHPFCAHELDKPEAVGVSCPA